jgi:hypothetical protein
VNRLEVLRGVTGVLKLKRWTGVVLTRVIVKPPNAEFFRLTIMDTAAVNQVHRGSKASWMELGTLGWWLSVDKPDAMRKLESRARDFVTFVKEQGDAEKTTVGYVETEHGVLSKNGKEILPLFLIPGKTGRRWSALVDLFINHIEQLDDTDWVAQYGAKSNEEFYRQWIDAAGLIELGADVRAIRAVDD